MDIHRAAGAKINLFLDVLGRRQDGYHEIVSLFLPVSPPADDIHIETAQPGTLSVVCDHPDVPGDERNLCHRAASAFALAAGVPPAWRIRIVKRIPVAAGLGGGSSDAAAVLRALAERHPGAVAPDALAALAARIGADVPFFLKAVPAVGTGIGEILRPVPCGGGFDVVLVNPGFPIPTAWAYAHWGRVSGPPPPSLEALLDALARGEAAGVAAGLYNALRPAAAAKFPLIGLLLEALCRAGCMGAELSGSGPTVFGICAPGTGTAVIDAIAAEFGPMAWLCNAGLPTVQGSPCS